MNKIDEARGMLEPLIDQYARECADIQGRPYPAKLAILDAANAYGAARELKGHVDACEKLEARPTEGGGDGRYHRCGDGWLCDEAKKILEVT